MKPAVVVTGLGLVSPLAVGREANWQKIKDGCAVQDLTISRNFGSSSASFLRFAPLKDSLKSHRIFAIARRAAEEALLDSGLNLAQIPPERRGCSVSVSKPVLPPDLKGAIQPCQTVGKDLRASLQFLGPQINCVAACASGLYSLWTAMNWLEQGLCDVAIAGAVESSLHPLYVAGFLQMGVLANLPQPFDARRKGFMLGEGAGILVLERKEDAAARKAFIYAEIAACALGSDTHHPVVFDASGKTIAAVVSHALRKAQVNSRDVEYVNLHGTGTRMNDAIETSAMKLSFGRDAGAIKYSSTKAATGHLLGASGALEAGITCLALRDQFIPPTANLRESDPQCDLDYTARKGTIKSMQTALSLSYGFGGSIGAILFQKNV